MINLTILLAIMLAIGYVLGLLLRGRFVPYGSPAANLLFPLAKRRLNSPVKADYDFKPPIFHLSYPYHCGDREMLLFTGSVTATILDFWMMLLPLPIAGNVDLPMKARIGVLGMFLLGLLICICGVIKFIYIHTYSRTHLR